MAEIRAGEEIYIQIIQGSSVLWGEIDWCLSNKIYLSSLSTNDKLEIKISFSKILWIPFIEFYYDTFGINKFLNIQKIV